MLSRADARIEPDLIIWLVTLESLPQSKQLASPILQHNAEAVRALIADYHLHSDPQDPRLVSPALWDRTLIGGRRPLADLIRLQTVRLPVGGDRRGPGHPGGVRSAAIGFGRGGELSRVAAARIKGKRPGLRRPFRRRG